MLRPMLTALLMLLRVALLSLSFKYYRTPKTIQHISKVNRICSTLIALSGNEALKMNAFCHAQMSSPIKATMNQTCKCHQSVKLEMGEAYMIISN